MAVEPATLTFFTELLRAHWSVGYVTIGCSTLLAVDYFQTLPDEVKYMWGLPLSPMRILFFSVRYYPFAHTFLMIKYHHAEGLVSDGPTVCYNLFLAFSFSSILICAICDAIAYIRIYAFSGRNRKLLAFLIPWYIALRVVEITLVLKFATSASFLFMFQEAGLGCIPGGGASVERLLSYVGVVALVDLLTLTAIMMYLSWRRRDAEYGVDGVSDMPSLYNVFLRDGIMFFVSISSFQIANIVLNKVAPQNGTQYATVQPSVHLNAILTGRMLIHLRSFAEKEVDMTPSGRYTLRDRVRTHRSVPSELYFRQSVSQDV